MSADPNNTCSWEQMQMFQGQSTEIQLRIGIVPGDNHLQFQVEAIDLGNGELIAMTSMHHCGTERADEIFAVFVQAANELMQSAMHPF